MRFFVGAAQDALGSRRGLSTLGILLSGIGGIFLLPFTVTELFLQLGHHLCRFGLHVSLGKVKADFRKLQVGLRGIVRHAQNSREILGVVSQGAARVLLNDRFVVVLGRLELFLAMSDVVDDVMTLSDQIEALVRVLFCAVLPDDLFEPLYAKPESLYLTVLLRHVSCRLEFALGTNEELIKRFRGKRA